MAEAAARAPGSKLAKRCAFLANAVTDVDKAAADLRAAFAEKFEESAESVTHELHTAYDDMIQKYSLVISSGAMSDPEVRFRGHSLHCLSLLVK